MIGNESKEEPRWISGIEPSSELLRSSIIEIYEKECREQPERLAELIEASRGREIREEMARFRSALAPERPLVFLGMGASYCSALAACSFLQSRGRFAVAMDAGEWLHYAGSLWDQVVGAVLLTTSGESAELVALLESDPGRPICLICNNERSKCWAAARIRLPILAGPEYANATKTYTNATAASIMLASELAGHPWREDAGRLLEIYPKCLGRIFAMSGQLRDFCSAAANIEVIGRGPSFGGAFMGALCIREMSGRRAAPHTGAGFRHGPLLDVNGSHAAIILALGRAAGLGIKLAHDCNARGGRVILVSTEPIEPAELLLPVTIEPVPEPWEAITSVLVSQALTLGLVEAFGANLKPRFQYGIMEQ